MVLAFLLSEDYWVVKPVPADVFVILFLNENELLRRLNVNDFVTSISTRRLVCVEMDLFWGATSINLSLFAWRHESVL